MNKMKGKVVFPVRQAVDGDWSVQGAGPMTDGNGGPGLASPSSGPDGEDKHERPT